MSHNFSHGFTQSLASWTECTTSSLQDRIHQAEVLNKLPHGSPRQYQSDLRLRRHSGHVRRRRRTQWGFQLTRSQVTRTASTLHDESATSILRQHFASSVPCLSTKLRGIVLYKTGNNLRVQVFWDVTPVAVLVRAGPRGHLNPWRWRHQHQTNLSFRVTCSNLKISFRGTNSARRTMDYCIFHPASRPPKHFNAN
jgi:hypothetical protein